MSELKVDADEAPGAAYPGAGVAEAIHGFEVGDAVGGGEIVGVTDALGIGVVIGVGVVVGVGVVAKRRARILQPPRVTPPSVVKRNVIDDPIEPT